ncbi:MULTISPECIES: hypothetical protein [Clostridia]|uniref:hypothetical protein n=1 Tax=Clostridia TaxID=186801 RepID=UPI000EA2D3ED|nr:MULTISPECIES: hypothetical protein [Clostridia]NBJ69422.1 hypothetical protein [Roseburia sp. 1XD42-34]RKI78818.1 hypothetical protein D7V87_08060 [Clostridium sp. 1xD42-85]
MNDIGDERKINHFRDRLYIAFFTIIALFMFFVSSGCSSSNSSTNPNSNPDEKGTIEAAIHINDPNLEETYIIRVRPEETPIYVDFKSGDYYAVYEEKGVTLTLEKDLLYQISVYSANEQLDADYKGILSNYVDEELANMNHRFNKDTKTLVIDLE